VPEDANIAEVQCASTQRRRIRFADGSTDVEADLIIGADGVRSVVGNAITGDAKQDSYHAVFEGLIGVGGLVPASRLPRDYLPGQLTLTFDAHGSFWLQSM